MPKIKKKSRQYLFKNKLNIRRKSKRELLRESFLMMIFGWLLLLLNYFIPEKIELFNSLRKNVSLILNNMLEILFYSLEIIMVLLICISILLSIFLILGSINRIFKVILPKTRKNRIR